MRRTILSSRFIGRLVIVALGATLAATLAVAAFTSTGAAQATKTANVVEGFFPPASTLNPTDSRLFPSQGVPLLKTFIFQFVPSYTKCVPQITDTCFGQVDHHIARILIWPNFHTLNEGVHLHHILLGFNDKNRDDAYYYNVQHYILTDPSIRRFDTGENHSVDGHATKTISRPTPASDYEFVLLGFSFDFPTSDHHIHQVGIIENNGKVTVDFNDEFSDDPFDYRIWYAYVPREMFITSGLGESSGTYAKNYAQKAIPDGPAVIRGFRFNYHSTCIGTNTVCADHHIKKIAVINQGGSVQVRYADKNGSDRDDGFDWRVKWGILNAFPNQPVDPPR